MEFDADTIQEFIGLATTLGLRETSYNNMREETWEVIQSTGLAEPEVAYESLSNYRPVTCAGLKPGDYLRWIRGPDAAPTGQASGPTVGGYVTAINPRPTGEHTIKCINTTGRHFQATTRPGLWLFRRLSDQELVVLSVLAALDQESMGEPMVRPPSPS
jgi:hypothetical protein